MAYGTLLRVTHSNTINSSIFLSDVHDGKDQNGRVNNRKPPQYVPVDGYVDLIFSEQVQYSYEQGAIRTFSNQGLISTTFLEGFRNITQEDFDGETGELLFKYTASVGLEDSEYKIVGGDGVTGFGQGTSISILGGDATVEGEQGGSITIQSGNGLGVGPAGSVEIRGSDSPTGDGGDIGIYGGRGGGVASAGAITISAGDNPSADGGDVNIYSGPVWGAGFSGGDINLLAGPVIDNVDATAGSVNISGGGIGGFIAVSNGGSVNLNGGEGRGAGHTAGDIELTPGTGNAGATNGAVLVNKELHLLDYVQDGVLSVSSSVVVSNAYGRQSFNVGIGVNAVIQQTVVGAFIGANSMIQVTLQAPNDALFLVTRSPVIREINGGANFIVDLGVNNTTGAVQTCVLHWMIIG